MISGKLEKRTRRPMLQRSGTDNRIHVFDEKLRAGRAELYDSDILTISVERIQLLRHVDDEIVAELDLHLFVAERVRIGIGNQQSIAVLGFKQVGEHLRMKQHVGIEHDETIHQMFARKPQRIHTARFGKPVVLDETDLVVATFTNALGAEANDNDDLSHVQTTERVYLPVPGRYDGKYPYAEVRRVFSS